MYESSLAATAYDCTLNQAMITFSLSTAPDVGSTFWMPRHPFTFRSTPERFERRDSRGRLPRCSDWKFQRRDFGR